MWLRYILWSAPCKLNACQILDIMKRYFQRKTSTEKPSFGNFRTRACACRFRRTSNAFLIADSPAWFSFFDANFEHSLSSAKSKAWLLVKYFSVVLWNALKPLLSYSALVGRHYTGAWCKRIIIIDLLAAEPKTVESDNYCFDIAAIAQSYSASREIVPLSTLCVLFAL